MDRMMRKGSKTLKVSVLLHAFTSSCLPCDDGHEANCPCCSKMSFGLLQEPNRPTASDERATARRPARDGGWKVERVKAIEERTS